MFSYFAMVSEIYWRVYFADREREERGIAFLSLDCLSQSRASIPIQFQTKLSFEKSSHLKLQTLTSFWWRQCAGNLGGVKAWILQQQSLRQRSNLLDIALRNNGAQDQKLLNLCNAFLFLFIFVIRSAAICTNDLMS